MDLKEIHLLLLKGLSLWYGYITLLYSKLIFKKKKAALTKHRPSSTFTFLPILVILMGEGRTAAPTRVLDMRIPGNTV